MTITARPPPSPPNDRREAIIETDIHDHRKPTYEAPPRNRHEASIDRQAPQTPIFSTLLMDTGARPHIGESGLWGVPKFTAACESSRRSDRRGSEHRCLTLERGSRHR